MSVDLLSKLDYPYREMLKSLKDVKGYDEFVKFIVPRVHKSDDWKAEVCALFEINKARHPLIEICSQESSTPEGIFKAGGGRAIIEAARIRYLFDTNEEKRKIINRIENCFKPISELLIGEYSTHNIRIEVDNIDEIISDIELEHAKVSVVELLRACKKPISVTTCFGRIAIVAGEGIDISDSGLDLLIAIAAKGGTVKQAYNADLNKKIPRVLKSKRTQHRAKYEEYLKLYYFLVDCPATKLLEVDLDRILRQLDHNEIVYMGAVFYRSQDGTSRLMRSGIIIPGKGIDPNHFDLSNKYFEGCPFPDPRYMKRIL